MRARGYRIEKTEQTVPYIFIKRDLFGFKIYVYKAEQVAHIQMRNEKNMPSVPERIPGLSGKDEILFACMRSLRKKRDYAQSIRDK